MIDWTPVTATLASRYDGLTSTAGLALRKSYAEPPDAVNMLPCAVTLMRGFRDITLNGQRIAGTARFDVLLMLEPSADVPRRYAAMAAFLYPATLAPLLGGAQLGTPGSLGALVPQDPEMTLAGDSEDYADLPYDLVRIPWEVGFTDNVAVIP